MIPDNEIRVSAARASGPGGQKVNKTASKAVLHWPVGDSEGLSEEQKDLVRDAAGNALNAQDEIVLSERQSRSWHQNRERVIERLQKLVEKALRPKKVRKKTKKSKAAEERRLREKKQQAEKKRLRNNPKTKEEI